MGTKRNIIAIRILKKGFIYRLVSLMFCTSMCICCNDQCLCHDLSVTTRTLPPIITTSLFLQYRQPVFFPHRHFLYGEEDKEPTPCTCWCIALLLTYQLKPPLCRSALTEWERMKISKPPRLFLTMKTC